MRNFTILMVFLTVTILGYGQSVSLPQASITPAPLASVQSNGTGVASFTFAESSGADVPATAFGLPNITISVNLQLVELTNS